MFGRDQYLLAALALGVKGAVGSTYNFNGKMTNSMIRRFNEGDIAGARTFQLPIATLIQYVSDWKQETGADGFKVLQSFIPNIDVGPARLPYLHPDDAARQQFKSLTRDWCRESFVRAEWCDHFQ